MTRLSSQTGVASLVAILVTLVALVGLAPQPAAAQSQKIADSLNWIPADASFYYASLRNREQWDLAANSKAWAKFQEIGFVQMARQMAEMQLNQPGGPMETVNLLFQMPENQQLLELAKDMVTEEVFVYGDETFARSTALLMDIYNTVNYEPLLVQIRGEGDEVNQQQAQARALMDALAANLDQVKVPHFVLGFKISDANRADFQLKRLEALVKMALAQAPPEFKNSLQRTKIGNADFLVLTVEGKSIPWDEIPIKGIEEEPGQYNKVVERLRAQKVVLCLGVRDGYLLVSISDSPDRLTRLGEGPKLAERPELKPVLKLADKRITDISYMSKAMVESVSDPMRSIQQLVDIGNEAAVSAELDDAAKAQIKKDLAQFVQDVKPYMPTFGASSMVCFLTPRGYESYSHDWTVYPHIDGSKPLPILEHMGGSPILAVAGRSKYQPEAYDLLVKWVKIGHGYFEKFAVPQMDDEDREKYQKFLELAKPLIVKVDQANRTMLIPALADSQAGFVLDADITSKQWHNELPSATKPLPMIELAVVLGVSDADLLRKGVKEYRDAAEKLVEIVRQYHPDAIPADYKIPQPKRKETSAGNIIWYPLPDDAGLDAQIAPSAGLSKNFAVISSSPTQVERLLVATPLKFPPALEAHSGPLAGAAVFDWSGFVDALGPWAEFGVGAFVPGEDPQSKMFTDQARSVLEILKVFRSYAAKSYIEQGALVTHDEWHFRDVE